ncbi:selenocysteine insertion sequence-binding protein 2 isoform X4 [Ochotona curzoniae]|uniref:selenocysteine insertion sequence-binding protein 2 isoform X4 n=1 Tax=Ochotona curzoniae TaxID=130825 RepID=UPI001B347AC0|nr:selenocysteine insertion sequence-binding protein 2 isoform X4 [Ochotona curzoniae]
MASEGRREPRDEGSMKLSADVKPFVPKLAGCHVAWSGSSGACAVPSYPATEQPVTEQKIYPGDLSFGASALPPQYASSEMALQPYAYSPYTLEPTRNICPVPGTQYEYTQASCYPGSQSVRPREELACPLPQDTLSPSKEKSFAGKKIYDEEFASRRADARSCEMKSARGSGLPTHELTISAFNSLLPDGYDKRTDRKSRIITKNASTSKSEFEFSSLDFPELQGPENRHMPLPPSPTWGPLCSASAGAPALQVGKPTAMSEGEILRKNNRNESLTDNAVTSVPSCTRDAKSVSMSCSEVSSPDPSYNTEKHVAHPAAKSKASQGDNLEQNVSSRKAKKKKEKSQSKYEVLTVQEPPRIEDDEEFPNLAVASARRDRVESPQCPSKHQPQNTFKNTGKKSQVPVRLDLGGMLTALEKKQRSQQARQSAKAVVFSVGAVPVLSKEATSGERGRRFSPVKTPHNPLDSSAPLVKKGKQREVPKAKKPTSLKKIILKERQERKQQRLQENTVSPAVDELQNPESCAEDQASGQAEPTGPLEADRAVSRPVVEVKSEEPLGTELLRDTEACQPAPDHAGLPKIHSRRFRDYCSQVLSKEVDACVTELLKELVRFQDRMYQKDPVKAKTKRRLVLGLREVLKHLRLKKLKCVIISPNCEKTQSKGGLDDTLHTIIDYACEQNIPFVFALNRKALGRSLNKAVPVSVVGIFSYDGAQDQFHRMVELTVAARQAYKNMLENVQHELAAEPEGPETPLQPVQGPSSSAEDGSAAPTEREVPHYIEVWRKHLETYNQYALELEQTLEASTAHMRNLKL